MEKNEMNKKKYELKDGFYKLSLLGVLILLIFINLYSLLNTFSIVTFIPLSIQSSILILISLKHDYQEVPIKIWSILLFIGGLAGIVATLALLASISLGGQDLDSEKLTWPYILDSVARLSAGIYFYTGYKKNIAEIKVNELTENDSALIEEK